MQTNCWPYDWQQGGDRHRRAYRIEGAYEIAKRGARLDRDVTRADDLVVRVDRDLP